MKFKFCKDKGKEGVKKGEDEGEYLDHNHTHFLLVKSESNDKEIIDIRSRLETHILKGESVKERERVYVCVCVLCVCLTVCLSVM